MKWTCCECGAQNNFKYKCTECGARNTVDFVCSECGALNDPSIRCKKCDHEFCGSCEAEEDYLDIDEQEFVYEDFLIDEPEEEESIPWY